jgi:hypothetical protein
MAKGATVLLDPRYHWLATSVRRLYAELEPGAVPLSLCLLAADDEQIIAYTVNPHDAEMGRRVVRNIAAIAAAGCEATIDVSPDDVPGVSPA